MINADKGFECIDNLPKGKARMHHNSGNGKCTSSIGDGAIFGVTEFSPDTTITQQ